MKLSLPGSRRLCIGAIVYNEAPYLLEWIAFHQLQGVEHFFIGDHDSDDGTTALLEALASTGLVTRLFHSRVFAANAQRIVYERIVELTKGTPHLVAFLDADEFLVPTNPEERAGDAIRELLGNWRTAALGINWRVFGSSGRIEAGEGLVIERFTDCNEPGARINRHIKSVIKPDCISSVEVHRCRLRFGYRYVNAEGESAPFDRTTGFAKDIEPVDGRLRINHYVVKSYREFIERKSQRGRATLGPGNRRDRHFFRAHDKTGYTESRAHAMAPAVHAQMERLRAGLRDTQFGRRVQPVGIQVEQHRLTGFLTSDDTLPDPVLICTEYLDGGRSVEHELALHAVDAGTDGAEPRWRYRFECPLPFSSGWSQVHGYRLRLRGNPAVLLDARQPGVFSEVVPPKPGQKLRPWSDHIGSLEASAPGVISGWTRHRDHADPVQVQLYAGKRRVATALAHLPRPHTVRNHQHPNGLCGFEFRLDELGLAPETPCRVRVENTRFWLPPAD